MRFLKLDLHERLLPSFMKKFIFTLLFSTLVFSSPSYARWAKVGTDKDGGTFYVDFDRIRKHDGYVYFWSLRDYLKPFEAMSEGTLSHKVYTQVDCKLFRFSDLSGSYYTEPMGNGAPEEWLNGDPEYWNDWNTTPSSYEIILKFVCSH